VANLEKIRANYQAQVMPLVQQVRAIDKEVATLRQQTPANLIQIKTKIQQAEPLRSELRYLRLEALENGKSILSAQQQDQLKTLLASMHQNFKKPPQGQAS
jgi:Spy/CpxP family protein refolding chaperone